MDNNNLEKILTERIKQLNAADVQFCEDRWSGSKSLQEKQLAREESNKVTFARQELQAILAALQPSTLPLIDDEEPDLVKELTEIRNKLYDDLLSGEIKAWDLIEIIKWHINDLDNFSSKLHSQLSSLTPKSIYKYFIEDTTNGRWLCLGDGFIDTHRTQAEDDELKWTNDANWALQWNTREEAEKYRKEFWNMDGIEVTEHEFPEPNPNKCTCKEGECCSKCIPTPKSIRDSDGWISVEYKSKIAESGTDILLLFESGEIRRLFEDDLPREIITHWQPLPAHPNEKATSWTDKQDSLDKAKSASLKPNKLSDSEKPKVICFCGSTRFAREFMICRWEYEKQGMITLGINILPDNYFAEGDAHGAEQEGVKEILDELHKRKIDLSDEVFVINVGGYIGESTGNEINYAKSICKPIKYLENIDP